MKKVLFLVLAVSLTAASCNYSAPPAQNQPNQKVSQNSSHSVAIQNFTFSPSSVTIKKGETVVWTNNDSAPHTVTGGSSGPASGNLASGQTYSFTFQTAGTFEYHCAIHPSMKGTVIVEP